MFIDIVRSRKSCRLFSDVPLEQGEMDLIMEAGLKAPSSRQLKDVKLFPVRDIGLIRRLALCKPSSTTPLETATFAVIVAADPEVCDVWIEDASIATIMMQLEAEDLGIGSCWLGGYPNEERVLFLKKALQVEEPLIPLWMIAFGHPKEQPSVKDKWEEDRIRFV